MKYLQWLSWSVSLPLQGLLLHALARGGFRSFPFLFLYTILLFLSTVANIAARESGRLPAEWQTAYWVAELVLQGLLYCLVLSLVRRALRASPQRRRILLSLTLVVVLFCAVACLATRTERINAWMTDFVKYVSFGGALLNLMVWSVLVGKRHQDRSLLMISGGYGLQSAGEAISQSLRALAVRSRSMPLLTAGNLIGVLTHTLCLWIWWRAVVHENARRARHEDPAGL
ncbi:MAG: hypothetical protein HY822_02690 [Acidobacteria bacterium]|nr:hypothetical protein [Acidobacteriota bacterium]